MMVPPLGATLVECFEECAFSTDSSACPLALIPSNADQVLS